MNLYARLTPGEAEQAKRAMRRSIGLLIVIVLIVIVLIGEIGGCS